MILEKRIANIGCIAPLMMAQIVPTRMKGHSEMFRRITCRNDTGGTSSSCKTDEVESYFGKRYSANFTVKIFGP